MFFYFKKKYLLKLLADTERLPRSQFHRCRNWWTGRSNTRLVDVLPTKLVDNWFELQSMYYQLGRSQLNLLREIEADCRQFDQNKKIGLRFAHQPLLQQMWTKRELAQLWRQKNRAVEAKNCWLAALEYGRELIEEAEQKFSCSWLIEQLECANDFISFLFENGDQEADHYAKTYLELGQQWLARYPAASLLLVALADVRLLQHCFCYQPVSISDFNCILADYDRALTLETRKKSRGKIFWHRGLACSLKVMSGGLTQEQELLLLQHALADLDHAVRSLNDPHTMSLANWSRLRIYDRLNSLGVKDAGKNKNLSVFQPYAQTVPRQQPAADGDFLTDTLSKSHLLHQPEPAEPIGIDTH